MSDVNQSIKATFFRDANSAARPGVPKEVSMSTRIAPMPARQDLAREVVRDGAAISYSLLKGTGPARIALVHSLAMDHRFWLPVAERLKQAGEVLVFDCRGHGESSKIGAPFTVEQFADDLADLFDAIGWENAAVAGASMGGTISIAFAQRYPQLTKALGLIDTTAWYGEKASEQWEDRAQKAIAGGLDVLVPFQKSRWFTAGFAETHVEVLDEAVSIFLANDIDAYAATCRMLGAADLRVGLTAMSMPTRILVGSEDYATPAAMAEAMRDAIPGATMQVLDGAAHLTPLERVDEVSTMLLSLMEVAA
ncbi:alpha/beta hydrolase [Bradyrhizobium sp. 14AA]